jgi:hypothetical protein
MTDHNTTDMQGSIKEQHRQGSLHPADPDMQLPGKGYSQNRIDPAGQSSLSGKQAVSSAQRSLSGKGEPGGIQRIVPFAITFVLGLLVAALIFRTVYAPSSNENEGTAASAGIEEQAAADEEEIPAEDTVGEEAPLVEMEEVTEEEDTVAPDAIVEIPDPVLKKALQDTLGIGDREITGKDALSLIKFEYSGYEKEQIKDIRKDKLKTYPFYNCI